MLSLILFVILVCSTGVVFGDELYSLPDNCTQIKPVKNIDYEKFVGTWTTIFQPLDSPTHCTVGTQTKIGHPKDRQFEIVVHFLNKGSETNGSYFVDAQLLNAKKPPGQYYFFRSGYPMVMSLFLLNDDFDTFLTFYTCFLDNKGRANEFVFVDARDPKVFNKTQLEQILKDNHLEKIPLEDATIGCHF